MRETESSQDTTRKLSEKGYDQKHCCSNMSEEFGDDQDIRKSIAWNGSKGNTIFNSGNRLIVRCSSDLSPKINPMNRNYANALHNDAVNNQFNPYQLYMYEFLLPMHSLTREGVTPTTYSSSSLGKNPLRCQVIDAYKHVPCYQ